MNLSKELKKKRDAEDRLRQSSPQKVFFPDGFIDLSQFANKNHAHKFIDLTDVPDNYIADKFVKVNAYGTALEYGDGGGGGISEIPQATESVLGGIKALEKTTAETSEVKIDSATGKLYSVPPTAALNGVAAGGTAGQIYSKIDGTDYNAQWIDAPSGGGYTNPIDQPPASPSAWDDEFSGTSLDAKWSRVTASNGTFTVLNGNLIINFAASSGDKGSAILQTAPLNDYEITVSIKDYLNLVNYSGFGIGLAQEISDTTPIIMFGFGYTSGYKIRATRWNSFTSYGQNYVGVDVGIFSGYFKIKKIGTTLTFYFSFTGDIFKQLYSVTAPFSIGAIGIMYSANGNTIDGAIDWFRVQEL